MISNVVACFLGAQKQHHRRMVPGLKDLFGDGTRSSDWGTLEIGNLLGAPLSVESKPNKGPKRWLSQ